MNKTFGILFMLTGVFAIVGGMFTWGEGSLFDQHELEKVLLPWADILLTGPLSLISSYGILRKHYWGPILGLCTCGIYLFGSLLVFIGIYWNKAYSLQLIIPASFGFLLGLGFILATLKEKRI